jgi:hypothetical protein
MPRHDAKIVQIDQGRAGNEPTRLPSFAEDQQAATNRLCIAISEAAEDLRLATDTLVLESEAMRMALDALRRIQATAITCSNRLIAARDMADHDSLQASQARLARPLGLAATATLAVNASIASSGNTLAEASLRIIRAGERFLEASRVADHSAAQLREASPTGNAHGDVAYRSDL